MDIESPRVLFKRLLAQKLAEELSKRNIELIYCETKAEVMKTVGQLVPKGSKISCGGSASLREVGIRAVLKTAEYTFLDPDDAQGGAAKEQTARDALTADVYLVSANAIAMSGEIVHLDGIGNRAAALTFGPKKVIIIAGFNKIAPSLDAAIERAKFWAAPQTLLLFKKDYASYDELRLAAESAYSQMLITRMSIYKDRVKLILCGEDLGF